jgi:hypothetical protein
MHMIVLPGGGYAGHAPIYRTGSGRVLYTCRAHR